VTDVTSKLYEIHNFSSYCIFVYNALLIPCSYLLSMCLSCSHTRNKMAEWWPSNTSWLCIPCAIIAIT